MTVISCTCLTCLWLILYVDYSNGSWTNRNSKKLDFGGGRCGNCFQVSLQILFWLLAELTMRKHCYVDYLEVDFRVYPTDEGELWRWWVVWGPNPENACTKIDHIAAFWSLRGETMWHLSRWILARKCRLSFSRSMTNFPLISGLYGYGSPTNSKFCPICSFSPRTCIGNTDTFTDS